MEMRSVTGTLLALSSTAVIIGCGGSSPAGSAGEDPSVVFRQQVHAAYDALPAEPPSPVAHKRAAIRVWEKFARSVSALHAPDALVGAKQQLLRDTSAVIAAIENIDPSEGSNIFTGQQPDYAAISADIKAESDAEGVVKADVAGL